VKAEIICSECGKKHWLPERNEDGIYHWLPERNEDGIYYRWLRCNCGHETDLNPKGSFIVTHKRREQ